MFNFLKKKKLVGKVPARFRVHGNQLIIFHYLLFEKGTKRLYEIQFIRDRKFAAKYWSTSPNRSIPFLDFISMSHKKWSKVVEPWLKNGTLDGMYTVDKDGESFACKLYRTAFPE